MSKGNTTENDILTYIFNNTAIPWSGQTNWYLALHTGDPGEDGDQSTFEVSYTSYTRVTVSRDGAGWTVNDNTCSNTALLQFPTCTGGDTTATHVSIGRTLDSTGQIMYKGALGSSLVISNNITPQFAVSALKIIEE